MSEAGDGSTPRRLRRAAGAAEKVSLPALLVASGSALAGILDLAGVAVAVMNLRGDYLGVNARFAAFGGRSPDHYLGRNHFELQGASAALRTLFEAVAGGGEPVAVLAREHRLLPTPLPGIGQWDWTLSRISDGSRNVLVMTLMDAAPRLRATAPGGAAVDA